MKGEKEKRMQGGYCNCPWSLGWIRREKSILKWWKKVKRSYNQKLGDQSKVEKNLKLWAPEGIGWKTQEVTLRAVCVNLG